MLQNILITGATSAIGSALARAYARSGVRLYLHGRNTEILAAVAEDCRAKGAAVATQVLDLRDLTGVREWVTGLEPLDLIVANAGMNTNVGSDGQAESWDAQECLLDVNLKATMLIVHSALPAMRARGRGQIALMSSLAAYFGLPVTPSYSASKAALKAYGEALRGWLKPENIKINVVMPGYVASPMCEGMPGPKPFLWTPERAAGVIQRALERDKARISFPFPLNWGCWWLAVLPAAWSVRIVRWLGYAP